MTIYKIADIITAMSPLHPLLEERSRKYILDSEEKQIEIKAILPLEYMAKEFKTGRYTSMSSCEYLLTGALFYRYALKFCSMYLHASAVGYKGNAYLFSAPCGTGKSTHAQNWISHFGNDAVIINDDKPLIRKLNGGYYVYGTPFSGKTKLNLDISMPLAGICFLEQGKKNHIEKMDRDEIFKNLFTQTLQPKKPEYMEKVLDFCAGLINEIPVYKLKCNTDISSAGISYEAMKP